MGKNTAREWLGSVLSRWADRLLYGNGHTLIIRDGDGVQIFNLTTSGGYAASNPPAPYTLECCDENLSDKIAAALEGGEQ